MSIVKVQNPLILIWKEGIHNLFENNNNNKFTPNLVLVVPQTPAPINSPLIDTVETSKTMPPLPPPPSPPPPSSPSPNTGKPDPTHPYPSSLLPPTNNGNKKKNQRKRKLTDVDIRDSAYFKIRALVHDLRPHFIEVLRIPEFWDCKAANEIRTRMKLVMDFYKLMQIEGNKRGKSEKTACRPLSPERNRGKKLFNGLRQEGTQEENRQVKQVPEQTAERKLSHSPISSEKKLEDGRPQGSYIVGGSVSGLNFITFTNRKPSVYYGVTKESYRSGLCQS